MSRPLLQFGVSQLEDMFAKSKADPNVLRQLEDELQHRQVPRAVALLAEVQTAISGSMPVAPPPIAPASPQKPTESSIRQPDLWNRLPEKSPISRPTVESAQPKPAASPATQLMPVDEAYKVLKATASSTWESIEKTRRSVVQQSSPAMANSVSAESLAQLQAEARRINAAYATVARHRVEKNRSEST